MLCARAVDASPGHGHVPWPSTLSSLAEFARFAEFAGFAGFAGRRYFKLQYTDSSNKMYYCYQYFVCLYQYIGILPPCKQYTCL